MKPIILLALVAMLLSFSACKDDDNDKSQLTNPSLLIKTATQYEDGKLTRTMNYEYDSIGRVTKIIYSPSYYEKYNYVSDTMILVQIHKNEYNSTTDTLLLNSKGLEVAKNHYLTFEYNNEGYMVKSMVSTNAVTINTFEVLNGNSEKITIHELDSVDNSDIHIEITHQYLTNSINTIGTENVGKPFCGKQNKNLVSKSQLKRIYPHSTIETDFTFSYELDRFHRVTRQNQENGPVSLSTVYTYND